MEETKSPPDTSIAFFHSFSAHFLLFTSSRFHELTVNSNFNSRYRLAKTSIYTDIWRSYYIITAEKLLNGENNKLLLAVLPFSRETTAGHDDNCIFCLVG